MFKSPFRSKKSEPATHAWDLDAPLLKWSRSDVWTVRDSVEGLFSAGATGSGKSSGSGPCIAYPMLQAGFGGLILTAKLDERAIWERRCRDAGRSDDLVVIGSDAKHRFNFLDHERSRGGEGAGIASNIARLFDSAIEVSERHLGGGRTNEEFWRSTKNELIINLVDGLLLAQNTISVSDLYRFVLSAPRSMDEVRSADWRAKSFCFDCLQRADKNSKSPRQERDFELVADYFLVAFPTLSEKTRSIIVASFTSLANTLNRGLIRELFSTDTTVTPEATEQGKIILLDLPIKEFGEAGQLAQVLFKRAFQRSIERRNIAANSRPVFLWMDEAQHFVTSGDMEFQTTCRAAKVATVMMTQNISNFYAAFGGSERGRAETDSLLANLNTKLFHCNGDPVTNEWASRLIGRSLQFRMNGSMSRPSEQDFLATQLPGWDDRASNVSGGFSESLEAEVEPREFTRLRTGGPGNNWMVDGIAFQNGRVFKESGRSWMRVAFPQRRS